jgi:hypothetical protein
MMQEFKGTEPPGERPVHLLLKGIRLESIHDRFEVACRVYKFPDQYFWAKTRRIAIHPAVKKFFLAGELETVLSDRFDVPLLTEVTHNPAHRPQSHTVRSGQISICPIH